MTSPRFSFRRSVLACGHPEEIVYNDAVRKVYLGEHFKM